MSLNAVLIAAVFVAAAYENSHPAKWLKELGLGDDSLKAGLWLVAVIVSLPMLIATSRKLQALGLLIAETKVTPEAAGERTAAIRAVVAQIVPLVGTVILGLYVIALSSTFMPSFKVFVVMLVLAALIGWLLERSFVKVYSLAQAALKETFSESPPPKPAEKPKALPSLLRDADLETVVIADGSPAMGKRIHELQLRAKSGANIVGIERQGASIVNPPPDEELLAGDEVLLLGNRAQLDAARKELQAA